MYPFTRRSFLTAASAIIGSFPFARRFGIARCAQPDTDALTLWYTRPAAQWIDALPIGNGRLGAMIFGGGARNPAAAPINATDPKADPDSGVLLTDPSKETLQLN